MSRQAQARNGRVKEKDGGIGLVNESMQRRLPAAKTTSTTTKGETESVVVLCRKTITRYEYGVRVHD